MNYNKNSFSLSMKIKPSIYETNSYLAKREPTIIEYSVFFGAIKIMRFLFQNNVQLIPSLWIYAIHSKNPEIIHFLENHASPDDIKNSNDEQKD